MQKFNKYFLLGLCLALMVVTSAWGQGEDHSINEISTALTTPISQQEQARARQVDDQLLSTGQFLGFRGYIVTDPNMLRRANFILGRLLSPLGQSEEKWVIRVIETKPKVSNAFVYGGKYVYIFTPIIEDAKSDDEIASTLGHEISHSLLHHVTRQEKSTTQNLSKVAELIAQLAKGRRGLEKVQPVTRAFRADYSRRSEEEADALGTVLVAKAGFDPLRGADFFTRSMRAEEEKVQSLFAERQEVDRAVVSCQQYNQVYQRYPGYQADLNRVQACNHAERLRLAYNAKVMAYYQEVSNRPPPIYMSHPSDQNRIAVIAAISDFLQGRRSETSLAAFQQTQKVIQAVRQTKPGLLSALSAPMKKEAEPFSVIQRPSIAERLRQLEQLYKQGLLTDSEYQKKRSEILSDL